MVRGLTSINHPDQLCEGCLLGKKFRTSFPKESNSRAKKPLELKHADVYGSIKLSSLGKNNYFLFFIDDFSRKTWVKAVVEKESDREIKAMRTDQGGEFTSKEF